MRDECAGHVAPERDSRRQRRVHFRDPELKQAVSGTPGERRADPLGASEVERARVGRFAHDQRPRGCQRNKEAPFHYFAGSRRSRIRPS